MNINRLKIIFYKFVLKYFQRYTGPYLFNKILALEGFEIGVGTVFFDPTSIRIDRQRPWMLKIGSYCKITAGVTILTHDYSRSVLRRVYGEILGEASMTTIGDNVFVGVNSIILMGAKIGNNVIVGAGSVVSGTIPDNVVIAGNPARIVRSLDEHYERRKSRTLQEAQMWFDSYKKRYGRYPSEREAGPFFPLFTNRETFDYENDKRLLCNGDNLNDIIGDFKKSKAIFSSYEKFIEFLNQRSSIQIRK